MKSAKAAEKTPLARAMNIQRGITAALDALRTRKDHPKAMRCPALGDSWVSFLWGSAGADPAGAPGELDATKRRKAFKRGSGLSHVFSKRLWEGHDPAWVLVMLAFTIEKGRVARTQHHGPVSHHDLEWEGFRLTLVKGFKEGDEIKPVTWMVTGFQMDEEGASGHSSRPPRYTQEGQFTNPPGGASPHLKDTAASEPVNESETLRRPPEPTGADRSHPPKKPRHSGPMANRKPKTNPGTTTPEAPAAKATTARKPLGLEKVWEKWTGAEPGQSFKLNLENPGDVPTHVVMLGRLSKLITKDGTTRDFGTTGPFMVTDEHMVSIWLVDVKNRRFGLDLDKGFICYWAKKPKFGDTAPVEYVHQFQGRARAGMSGETGYITGRYRLTPRGIEG